MQTAKHTAEQIVAKLRQAEVELAKGRTIPQVSKLLGITEQTYYRWRKEFGGLRLDQAKRLKQLEQENARLKKVVADLTLDNAMLKEVADPNFFRRHGDGRRKCKPASGSACRSDGRVGCCTSPEPRSGDSCGCRKMSRGWWRR
jgi:transposase-like protein